MSENAEKYKVGTRIYYTGDMANRESAGTITRFHPPGRFNPEAVDIEYDEERFEGDTERSSRMVYLLGFKPGPGRRFLLLEEYEANRDKAIKDMQERYKKMMAQKEGP